MNLIGNYTTRFANKIIEMNQNVFEAEVSF